MTGGVRKRGKTWSYYFDIGIVDGKRKKKEKGGFRTKKEAETALASALKEFNETGSTFTPSEKSLSDYLDEWFNSYVIVNLRYNSQACRKKYITNNIKPAIGIYKLKNLNPAILQEFINNLKLQQYSKNTIEGICQTLSSALDYAVYPLAYLQMNPMKSVKMPVIEKKVVKQRTELTTDQVDTILHMYPKTNRHHLPLLIGYYCAVRISECFGLTWDDVDLDNRTITINHQFFRRKRTIDESKTGWYIQPVKTDSSNRTIKFGQTLYDALLYAKNSQEDAEKDYGDYYYVQIKTPEHDEKGNLMYHIETIPKSELKKQDRIRFVCVDVNGQHTTQMTFRHISDNISKKLGIDFDYHSLRHTHATKMIENKISPVSVQKRLGHASITTTLSTYVHDTEQMQDDAVEIFEQHAKMPPK